MGSNGMRPRRTVVCTKARRATQKKRADLHTVKPLPAVVSEKADSALASGESGQGRRMKTVGRTKSERDEEQLGSF